MSDLLKRVSYVATSLRAARELNRARLAPEYNVFDFIKSDELGLSKIIAWLLDPKGSHGQGGRFLASFTAELGPNYTARWTSDLCLAANVGVEVATRYIGRKNRRIDILVASGGSAIAIENKPRAADQPDQVSDYLAQLDGEFGSNHVLVYLSNREDGVPEASLRAADRQRRRKNKQLFEMTYRDFADWLRRCRGVCEAQRVSALLTDMADWLDKNISGEQSMTEQDEIVEIILSSREATAAAFRVYNASESLRSKLLVKLVDDVRSQIYINGHLTWKIVDEFKSNTFPTLSVQIEGAPRYLISLQATNRRFNDIAYGVATGSEKLEAVDADLRSDIISELGAGIGGDVWWPWYRNLKTSDAAMPFPSNWSAEPEVWGCLIDGTMAKRFVELAERLEPILIKARG